MARSKTAAAPRTDSPAAQALVKFIEAVAAKDHVAMRAAVMLRPEASSEELRVRVANITLEATESPYEATAAAEVRAAAAAARGAADAAFENARAIDDKIASTKVELENAVLRVQQVSNTDAKTPADVVAAENARRLVERLTAAIPKLQHQLNVATKKGEQLDETADKIEAQVLGKEIEADSERVMLMIARIERELEVAFAQNPRIALVYGGRGKTSLERAGDALTGWESARARSREVGERMRRDEEQSEKELGALKRKPLSEELFAEAFPEDAARVKRERAAARFEAKLKDDDVGSRERRRGGEV